MSPESPKSPVSVLICTKNEERNLRDCLKGVAWADDCVVLDSYSEDTTVTIAREQGARVVQRQFDNFSTHKNWALDNIDFRHDWILIVDADERVTPELAREIAALVNGSPPHHGYYLARQNWFAGTWIRHGGWWPDPQLRLVRRDRAAISGAPGHETLHVDGRVQDLAGSISHDTHPTLSAAFSRVERYSTHLAKDRARRKRIRPWHLFTHPAAAFLRKWIVQRGFLDGTHGFLVAAIHATVKLATYAKAWELQRRDGERGRR